MIIQMVALLFRLQGSVSMIFKNSQFWKNLLLVTQLSGQFSTFFSPSYMNSGPKMRAYLGLFFLFARLNFNLHQ